MNYKFELATHDDAQELSIVKKKCWNTTYQGIYPDSKLKNFNLEEHKKEFIKIIEDDNKKLYKIVVKNKIIGYIEYGILRKKYKNYIQEIGVFYILKEYQHRGIGTAAFKFAMNEMKQKGYHEFVVACNKYNFNAQKFYEKMNGKIDSIDADKEDGSAQIHYYFKII